MNTNALKDDKSGLEQLELLIRAEHVYARMLISINPLKTSLKHFTLLFILLLQMIIPVLSCCGFSRVFLFVLEICQVI